MRELFLTSFSGIQYGIWKDEIRSVRDIHALHRIPLSPARIAGIMVDDGRTVTLTDLPVCIGHESTQGIEQGCILLKEEDDKVMGFVVGGELRTQPISPGLVFPLPEFLKSPVLETCAVHDDITIPIINITELYLRVLKSDDLFSANSLRISCAKTQDVSEISRVRCFAAGGELFAVPAAGIEDKAVKPGLITPLPDTPQYVKGVTFWNGRLLPVIDLSQRIKSQSVAPDHLMLIAEIGVATFGLLIDGDAGMLSADKVLIKPAPMIARTSWLKHVVVRADELIPLMDLSMALLPGFGMDDEMPVWQRYAPDSCFPEFFFMHEVGVVEFSLLGERYALPKQEVEDIIAFKPCRALPDVPSIVIGVAEHKGEILPVVDLAMMFGRRSLSAPEWRMMLVSNGNFRALVITEAVFGERNLPLDIHRTVPIHLPHNLMYGCYPNENVVRIILNVEAISVHFEKSLIQKFIPVLSHQMRMSPTGVVYKFPEEKAGEEPQPSATVTSVETQAQGRAEAEPVFEAAGMSGESTEQEFIAAENIDLARASSQAVPEFKQQAEVEEAEFVELDGCETAVPPIAPESGQIDVADAAVPEKTIIPETNTEAEKTPEPTIPLHSASAQTSSSESNKAREPVAMSEQSPLEALKASAKKKQAQKVSRAATVDIHPAEPIRTTASAKSGTPYRMSREVEQLATLSGHEERTAGSWKLTFAFTAIAAMLIAFVFYYLGTSDNPVVEHFMQGTEPVKIDQAKSQNNPPLELDIPKNRPTNIDVYVVREGDTLWSISERFTGSPYNYPRIAGENRIADPDLIFPEQRVRLIK